MNRFVILMMETCFSIVDTTDNDHVADFQDFNYACDYMEGLVGETE